MYAMLTPRHVLTLATASTTSGRNTFHHPCTSNCDILINDTLTTKNFEGILLPSAARTKKLRALHRLWKYI